jgi:Na+/H+ antiporter NhaA
MADVVGGRTVWRREFAAPLRAFLRTEAGSSGVLAAAIVVALLWANVAPGTYDEVWRTELTIGLGHDELGLDLREWINSGLMTLFFLVVGLEARREFDLGDLRDRTRFVLPMLAGIAGMIAPILIYLAFNAGGPGSHGWGVAMSTDTALALGLLALVGRGVPDRVRVFLLTVFVVDDLLALVVIAVVYSEDVRLRPLALAIAAFAVVLVLAYLHVRKSWVYVVLGVLMWAALLKSGVDPVVAVNGSRCSLRWRVW